MDLVHLLPFLSTGITLLFTLAVFSRYFRRRGLHLLLWGVGLALSGFRPQDRLTWLLEVLPALIARLRSVLH